MNNRHNVFSRVLAVFLVLLMMFSAIPAGIITLPAANALSMKDPIDYLESDEARLDMNFNKNWKFHLGDQSLAYSSSISDAAWDSVDLPHDFSITQDFTTNGTENESGNLPGGTGWYRKAFTVPSALRGKRIILNFGASYNNTYVYVNNKLVGENHYGYNSFSFDITDYLVDGDGLSTVNGTSVNLIAVKVVHQIPSSRWYSGSGLFNDVTITAVSPVHVSLYGTQVTTADNASDGTATTKVTLQNDGTGSKTVTVKAKVIKTDGSANGSEVSQSVTVSPSAKQTVTLSPVGTEHNLWSPDSPQLYKVRTEVYEGSTLIDQYDTTFGYRWIEWTVNNGFYINGVPTKIKGVCMHHDQGALGSIQTYDAIYRQVKILKDSGCNAIRSSHNCPSSVYLQVCDELGMLFMDEMFDGWDTAKNANSHDFGEYFSTAIASTNKIIGAESGDKWYQFVLREMVKRDRNSPSVICWSSANELNHMAGGISTAIAQDIANIVAQNDYRPVTQGNNQQGLMTIDTYMNLIGANYYLSSWVSKSLSKPLVSTEAASAVSSRGVYSNNQSDNYSGQSGASVSYAKNEQINSYDASRVSWGQTAADSWYYCAAYPKLSGEFVWTGFDYIGEPTPWWSSGSLGSTAPNSSYFGFIDTAGFAKDSYYLYRSMWNETSNTLHLVPGTWVQSSLGNKSSVPVAVYANGNNIKTIRLYLNDTLVGHATATAHTAGEYTYYTWSAASDSSKCSATTISGSNSHDLYPAFSVNYEAGSLSVKAFDASGNEVTDTVGTTKVSSSVTASSVTKIESKVVTSSEVMADGESYVYVEYTAVDANGNFVNDFNGTMKVTLEGSTAGCEIAGVDNGNAAATNKFQQASVFTSGDREVAQLDFFNGKALAVVRTTNSDKSGYIRLSQVKEGDAAFIADGVTVKVNSDSVKDEYEEICPQGTLEYTSTLEETKTALQSAIEALDINAVDDEPINFNKYTPSGTGSGQYLEDGIYVIYCNSPENGGDPAAISHRDNTTSNTVGLDRDMTGTINGTVYTNANPVDVEFTFTYAGTGNKYYIQDSTGKYLTIGNANQNLSLTDTRATLNVYTYSDGRIAIYNDNNYFVDYFSGEYNMGYPFSSWSGATGSANGNKKFVLYKMETVVHTYEKYTPATSGQFVENGNYIIRGRHNGSNTNPILLKTVSGSGVAMTTDYTIDGNIITTPDSVDAVWNIRVVDAATNKYYVTCNVNGTIYYPVFTDGGMSLTTTQTQSKIYTSTSAQGYINLGNANNGYTANVTASNLMKGWTNTTVSDANSKLELYRETRSAVQERVYSDTDEIYSFYEANPDSITRTGAGTYIPDGWYGVWGETNDGTRSTVGFMTSNSNGSGTLASDEHYLTSDNEHLGWYFDKVDKTNLSDDEYQIYTMQNGARMYLDVQNKGSGIHLSATPVTLHVAINTTDNTITIGNGTGGYVNYGGGSYAAKVMSWDSSTPLELHATAYSVSHEAGGYIYQGIQTASNSNETLPAGYYMIGAYSGSNSYNRFLYQSGDTQQALNSITVPAVATDMRYLWYSDGNYIKSVSNNKYIDNASRDSLRLGLVNNVYNQVIRSYNANGTTYWGVKHGSATEYFNTNTSLGYIVSWNAGPANSEGSRLVFHRFNYVDSTDKYTFTFSSSKYEPITSEGTVTGSVKGIENGKYIIFNQEYALAPDYSSGSTTTIARADITRNIVTDEVTSHHDNEYTITGIENSDNLYYVQNNAGKYLVVNTNGTASLSSTQTPVKLIVNPVTHKLHICNEAGTHALGHEVNVANFHTYAYDVASTSQIMSLYKDSDRYVDITPQNVSGSKGDLYTALTEAINYDPDGYNTSDYADLLTKILDGLTAILDTSKTSAEYAEYAEAIHAAVEALRLNVKYYDASIFKYGYTPTNTGANKYATDGGKNFNIQSVLAMKEAILSNADLVSQIKELIGYDDESVAWASDDYKDNAVKLVAEYYARLYTLIFDGNGKKGGSDAGFVANGAYGAAWNFWSKRYCWDSSKDEAYNRDEGASVLGLFSTELNNADVPTSHTAYSSPVVYKNISVNQYGMGVTSEKSVNVAISSSANKTVTLTPLQNISVYVPDFFSDTDVLSGVDTSAGVTLSGTNVPATNNSATYSKYHWKTQFPFTVTTDEYGVETYRYDSTTNDYIYRAHFDDENQVATSVLQRMGSQGWSIERNSKGTGDGFFPFNYQMTSADGDEQTSFSGENAIYHFGMTFEGDFTMPLSGFNPGKRDIVFNFSGDDDVLVYVDGKLILDDGGIHGARAVSINFSQKSVTYQFVYDSVSGQVVTPLTGSGNNAVATKNVTFKYGATEDNIANGIELVPEVQGALDKLNEIWGDGKMHNFNFFYLERGSTDSNCIIDFNLPTAEEAVHSEETTLVLDYGQKVEYNFDNETLRKKVGTNATAEYLGVILGNHAGKLPVGHETEEEVIANLDYSFADGDTITIDGTIGTFKVNNHGQTVFTPKTMKFDNYESYYTVLKFVDGLVTTYCLEKITYLPATTVYYEDTHSAISYVDSANAQWTKVGSEVGAAQAADIVGADGTNIYGYDPSYSNYAEYSDGAAHKVTVGAKASSTPNWPYAEFTFAGTGFDVIGVTKNDTGVFVVSVYDVNGNRVYYKMVDTYYGFAYGKLFVDSRGKATLTDTGTPLYYATKTPEQILALSEDEQKNYIVSSSTLKGGIYTKNTNEGEEAYGWLIDESASSTLYQVPVLKASNLPYGTYTAKVEARYTSIFGHNTNGSYDLYLDAIRIYDPAGVANTNSTTNKVISDAYAADNENYGYYTEIKDLIKGAETLSSDENTEGIIYIDGNNAVKTDNLDSYLEIGPNNELYLDGNQSIAFEIWATSVPEDIQIGAKLAQGSQAKLKVTSDYKDKETSIITSTDMYYSIDRLIEEPIAWKLQKGNDNNWYYTSGTIVITNSADAGNILSITSIRWTFDIYGANGHYRIPTSLQPEVAAFSLMSDDVSTEEFTLEVSPAIARKAVRMVSQVNAEDLEITENDVTVGSSEIKPGEDAVISIKTSTSVDSLIITDKDGNVVTPDDINSVITELEGKAVKQWTVTVKQGEAGTYTYNIVGAYEDGYTGSNTPVTVTVNVKADSEEITENPENPTEPDNGGENEGGNDNSFLAKLKGFFDSIREFFKKLLSYFGINV